MGRPRARHVPVVDLVGGLCPAEDAATLVAARRVRVDGVLITNTRARVRPSAAVRILPARRLRGSIKLGAALERFGIGVSGRVALDLGAAAGGFTSALLEAGARLVYAVDVGHGQLLGRLRVDHRVVNLESTNLADLHAGLVPETVELVTADLSYLPASVGVGQLRRLTYSADADLVWLVKPAFELALAAPPDDPASLLAAGAQAAKAMSSEGWRVLATVQSPVRARRGTIELFIHARRDEWGAAMSAPRHPNYRSPASLPKELRRTTVPHAVQQWAREELGAAVERVSRLPGASSTAVHRLDLAGGGRVVLRRYVWPGFVAEDPAAPQREVDALGFAATVGVPAPVVLAADVDGSHIGDGIPAVIMTFLRGRARAGPDLRSLAAAASVIHAVDASDFPHRYYRWYEGVVTVPPAGATDSARWERAIEIWHASMPHYRPGFLHRDFHPGNVLWTRGTLTGVVDWPNACAGPWGCDVAHCRDNLLQLGGPDAADAFLAAYLDLTGERYDPYWEIASVLEHAPSGFDAEHIAISEARLGPAVAAYAG